MENLNDLIAGFRCLKLIAGIGPQLAMKILEEVGANTNRNLPSTLVVARPARLGWAEFRKLQVKLAEVKWSNQLVRVIRWYKPHLAKLPGNPDSRAADLEQLKLIGANYKTRRLFLTDLTIEPPDSVTQAQSDDADYTILSTIHSAKGKEWKHVRILNVIEGCIPSSRAKTAADLEEERRLLFVAMSRTQEELQLIMPLQSLSQYRGGNWDNHSVVLKPSRFISKPMKKLFHQRVVKRKAS